MRASYAKDLIRVKILPNEDRSFQIGAGLKDEGRIKMLLLLVQNIGACLDKVFPQLNSQFP